MKKQNMNNEKYKICKANFNVGARLRPCPSRQNTQKGITLIALIITIIILLILAVVSIRLVVNNGILGKAEHAVDEYSKAETDEQEKLLKAEYEMAKYEGKATGTYEEYVLDKMYGLKIGDYVNYDPTEGATTTSVTSYSAENGYGDQTFKLASYKNAGYGWRVLGIENGKIQLISEEFIGPDEGGYTNTTYNRTYYGLQGQAGYINGINELNKISSMYGQGKGAEGARSITVDDVNKITGYNPETARYGKGNFNEYGNKVTYTRGSGTALSTSGTNGTTWSGTQSTFNYYDKTTRTFVLLTSGSIDITSTFYCYNPTTLDAAQKAPITGINEDGTYNTAFEMLFGKYKVTEANGYFREFTGNGAPQYYWLASDYAYADSCNVDWGLRLVSYGDVGGNYGIYGRLYLSGGGTINNLRGVRAVVSLKSDIQLEYNSTAGEWEIK